MPFQLLVVPKAIAMGKAATGALSEWNKLPSEQKALVQEPAIEVMRGLNELRGALGHRLFRRREPLSWEETRALALDPSPHFRLARQVAETVAREQRISHEQLVRTADAVGSADTDLALALEIAEDDNYIRADGDEWVVTDFADRSLVESEHVVYLEQCIVEYIDEIGFAGRDVLAEAVGAASFASEDFQAALERALSAQSVHWLEHALYGLPPERLASFRPPMEADEDAAPPPEVRKVMRSLTQSVAQLRRALVEARRSVPDAASAGVYARDPSASASPEVDPLERLGRLKQLLDAGALSEEEFAEQKARLLAAL